MSTGLPAKIRSPLVAMSERFNIEPDKLLQTLKGTVIRPTNNHSATNEEIASFCIVAQQYQLNPFTKEIHAFVSERQGIVPIVGIDGWAKLVNNHDEYDGCEFEEVDDVNGKPLKTTCIMYHKQRRHPVKVTEWLAECKRNSPPWNTMPRRMLRHKAYMQAARMAFGFSGVYDLDEAHDIVDRDKDRDSEGNAIPRYEDESQDHRSDEAPVELAAKRLRGPVEKHEPAAVTEAVATKVEEVVAQGATEAPPEPAKPKSIIERIQDCVTIDDLRPIYLEMEHALKEGTLENSDATVCNFYYSATILAQTVDQLTWLTKKHKAHAKYIPTAEKSKVDQWLKDAEARIVQPEPEPETQAEIPF